jgi:hypothetical protein
MPQLFRRRVEVIVGTTNVSELEVEFKIEADLKPSPDTATLRIHNLGRDSRGKIEAEDRGALVRVKAGFQDSVSQIFVGELRRAFTEREDQAVVTTVEAGAGDRFRALDVRLNKSYRRGTAVSTVANNLIGYLGVGRGNVDQYLRRLDMGGVARAFSGGYTLDGNAWDRLTELFDFSGYLLTIQEQALFVAPKDGPGQTLAILVSPGSGLYGSPSVDKKGRLTCTTAIIPGLFPGRKLKVESDFVNGTFTADKCTYTGSLFGDEYQTAVEAKPLATV